MGTWQQIPIEEALEAWRWENNKIKQLVKGIRAGRLWSNLVSQGIFFFFFLLIRKLNNFSLSPKTLVITY